jgi:hypothetical protein
MNLSKAQATVKTVVRTSYAMRPNLKATRFVRNLNKMMNAVARGK